MPQLAKYIGTKTAFYNDRSYFPGEIMEVPDELPVKDKWGKPVLDEKGKPVMRRLVFGPQSRMRLATEEERAEYLRSHPRAARRQENAEVAERQEALPSARGRFKDRERIKQAQTGGTIAR